MTTDCGGAARASGVRRRLATHVAPGLLALSLALGAPGGAGAATWSVGREDAGIDLGAPVDGAVVPTAGAGDLLADVGRRLGRPASGYPVALLEPVPRLLDILPSSRPDPLVEEAALRLGPNVSGLPWRSGESCVDPGFAGWRKRPIDVNVFFTHHRTLAELAATFQEPAFKAAFGLSPTPVVSMPMLTKDHPKAFQACSRGAFDPSYQQYAKLLAQLARGKSLVIRLGWEANIGSGSHPWGIDTTADIPNYIKCFRRQAGIFKAAVPNSTIEWTNAKVTNLTVAATNAYPGDDVVDGFGLHYYDRNAQFRTQAGWDAYFNSKYKGGPQGLGAWLKIAVSHGKRLAVPEWGLWNEAPPASRSDDPVYIQNMFNFLKSNAANISYDNYFNCQPVTAIYPNSVFPKGSALYRKLWSAGR